MPKKKTPRNGFYFFMQDVMQDMRREGRVFPNGMADVVPVAHPRWKLLPVDERERYERLAKEEKRKNQGKRSDSERLDNVGNVIAERLDPNKEIEKRRVRESKITKSRWPPDTEIIDEKFYFISFEYMIQTEEGEFRPMEVGMVEFSLKAGITKTYHTFIEPGPIPLGYRYQAQSHSDDTHQIPIKDFELANNNYRGIWIQLENFINPSGKKKEYPPMYAQNVDLQCVEATLDWLHAHAAVGYANRLSKVFELENMVVSLYARGGAQISIAGAMELLSTSAFDYEPNTRCKWHEEKEAKCCALGTVKRFAYALADSLADIYDFELLPNSHLPEQPDEPPSYAVLPPSSIKMDYRPVSNKTSGYGPATGAVSWNRMSPASSFSQDDGPYASRDIRYMKPKPEKSTEEFEVPSSSHVPETVRRPNIPGSSATAVWAAGIGRGMPPSGPGLDNDGDWPSLGGSTEKGKYAGACVPPPPSAAPCPPTSWQSTTTSDVNQMHKAKGEPYVEHLVEKPTLAKPTIHQAVQAQHTQLPHAPASKEQGNSHLHASMSQPANGTFQPVRQVTARGCPPQSRGGGRGSRAARAPGYQPPRSTAGSLPTGYPYTDSSQSMSAQTTPLHQTTIASSAPAQGHDYQSLTNDSNSWPSLTDTVGIGRGRGTGGMQFQVPFIGVGLGRGRGIWNPGGKVKSEHTSIRHPPGFGRGLINQMSSMSTADPAIGQNSLNMDYSLI